MMSTAIDHNRPAGHDHPHDHDHSDDHDHPTPEVPVTALGVSSVLDIGGTIGALVVYLDDQPAGAELDICPSGRPEHRFHTGIHPRRFDDITVDVAVYPNVAEGTYDLLDHALRPFASVQVAGGEVTELDLCTTPIDERGATGPTI